MKRGRKGARPVGSLFAGLLPADFARQRVLIEQYRQFFAGFESDPALQSVEVLHVGEQTLSLAVPSPAHSAYLRQHARELEQAIREQFGQSLKLRISVDPALMTPQRPEPRMPPARPVGDEALARIERSAELVEDEELGAALKNLAATLKKRFED